jgi:hypothetical protein
MGCRTVTAVLMASVAALIAAPHAGAAPSTVLYEVSSDGPLRFVQWQDESGFMQFLSWQSDYPSFPVTSWSKTISSQATQRYPNQALYLLMADTWGTQVSCRVTVNGRVVDQQDDNKRNGVMCCQRLADGTCVPPQY